MESAPPTDPLRAFLSGKRQHQRHAVSLPVEVSGAGVQFDARAMDLSTGGALVAITERALSGQRLEEEDVLAVVHRCLGDGFDLRFVEHAVEVETELVRLSVPAGQAGVLLLGCRFAHALSPTQRTALGIEEATEDDGTNGLVTDDAPIDELPLEPRPGRVPHMLLFDDGKDLAGPRYVGRVTGLGARAFAVTIDAKDPREVARHLGSEGLHIRVVLDGRSWASEASLLTARYLDVPGGAVELALLSDDAPTRALRRVFRRRAA